MPIELDDLLQPVLDFLPCETPVSWVKKAVLELPTLLINHCYLEQCAARNAMVMITRYPDKPDLLVKMSKLAREELVHFERVLSLLHKRGLTYKPHKPSRYAGLLQNVVSKSEPDKFVDSMIVGALIEARSCERFYRLIPYLDEVLAKFYHSLLQSEARHFQDYLALATQYSPYAIDERVAFFKAIEADAILSADDLFRFHSGVPIEQVA